MKKLKINQLMMKFLILVKKRGCIVIRNVFKKEIVVEWNDEIERYIDENNYYDDQKEKGRLGSIF